MERELISAVVLFIVLVIIILSAVMLMYKKYINNLLAKERNLKQIQIKHKEQLLAHVIQAEEKERKSIAEDLHDNLTARLNILRLQIYDQDCSEGENKLLGDLDKCIELSRNISHKLKSPILEKFGLLPALKDLLDAFHQNYIVDIYELATDSDIRLNVTQELHLYRIAQEILVNILKHSKASAIQILWRNTPARFVLIMRDNGIGIKPDSEKGIGMSNILARVDYLKAKSKIRTSPNLGTSITIIIPK